MWSQTQCFTEISTINRQDKELGGCYVADKVLTLNNACVTEESTRGKIMNVVSTDMEILELTVYAVYFLASPFVAVTSIVIIAIGFGPAGLVGIAISLLHIPIVVFFGTKTLKIRLKANKVGDTRIKMIQNLIEGIKIMKLYAWEIPFLKSIFLVRKKEISILSTATKNNALMGMINLAGLGLVIFGSLCTKVSVDGEMSPADVFMAISVFYLTQFNVVMVSNIGVNTIFAFVGIMKRVGQILMLKEHKPNAIECAIQYSISMNDVSFSWREFQQTYSEINNSTVGLM